MLRAWQISERRNVTGLQHSGQTVQFAQKAPMTREGVWDSIPLRISILFSMEWRIRNNYQTLPLSGDVYQCVFHSSMCSQIIFSNYSGIHPDLTTWRRSMVRIVDVFYLFLWDVRYQVGNVYLKIRYTSLLLAKVDFLDLRERFWLA